MTKFREAMSRLTISGPTNHPSRSSPEPMVIDGGPLSKTQEKIPEAKKKEAPFVKRDETGDSGATGGGSTQTSLKIKQRRAYKRTFKDVNPTGIRR